MIDLQNEQFEYLFAVFAAAIPLFYHFGPYGFIWSYFAALSTNALVLPMLAIITDKRHLKIYLAVFGIALALDSFVMFFKGSGILFGPVSFETAIMAVMVPILWKGRGRILSVFFVANILYFQSRTGILALAAASLVNKKARPYVLTLSAVAFLVVSKLKNYPETRLIAWKTYLKYFVENGAPFFGFGPNSFERIAGGLEIWVTENEMARLRLAHNDFLQCLIEYGFPGLLGMLFLAHSSIYLAPTPRLKAANIAMVAVMLTYFPSHYLFSQILILILMRFSLCSD